MTDFLLAGCGESPFLNIYPVEWGQHGTEAPPMRRRREPQVSMLAFADLEARGPPDHPLRSIKAVADQALAALSPEFDRM